MSPLTVASNSWPHLARTSPLKDNKEEVFPTPQRKRDAPPGVGRAFQGCLFRYRREDAGVTKRYELINRKQDFSCDVHLSRNLSHPCNCICLYIFFISRRFGYILVSFYLILSSLVGSFLLLHIRFSCIPFSLLHIYCMLHTQYIFLPSNNFHCLLKRGAFILPAVLCLLTMEILLLIGISIEYHDDETAPFTS